jgi:hypothetical protein
MLAKLEKILKHSYAQLNYQFMTNLFQFIPPSVSLV